MPLFLIERGFAERLDLSDDAVRAIEDANDEAHVRWMLSFLSADKLRSYCLYEASSAEAIRAAARRANMPADAIVPVEEIDAALLRERIGR